jgi:hypothetical protein
VKLLRGRVHNDTTTQLAAPAAGEDNMKRTDGLMAAPNNGVRPCGTSSTFYREYCLARLTEMRRFELSH